MYILFTFSMYPTGLNFIQKPLAQLFLQSPVLGPPFSGCLMTSNHHSNGNSPLRWAQVLCPPEWTICIGVGLN